MNYPCMFVNLYFPFKKSSLTDVYDTRIELLRLFFKFYAQGGEGRVLSR